MDNRKRILITHPLPEGAEDVLKKADMEVIVSPKKSYSEKEFISLVHKHKPDGIITYLTDPLSKKVIESIKSVRIISNFAVGYNNIDLEAAKAQGKAVTNTPIDGYSVAEFAASLTVSLSRRVAEAHMFTVKGKYKGWDPNIFIGETLRGKTLGIIGSGHIGSTTAAILHRGFDMKVVYSDIAPNEKIEKELGAKRLETDELFKVADVVSLHVNLSDATKHLVNAKRLASMKRNAIVINTARGPVVEEKALVTALSKGEIAGAALDVFEFEPKIAKALMKMPNVILTPHIASATKEARSDMSLIAAQNVVDFFAGKKPAGAVYIPN